jgi:hypothetical protein
MRSLALNAVRNAPRRGVLAHRRLPAPVNWSPTPRGKTVSNWELVLYMGFADRRRRTRDVTGETSDPDCAPLPLPISAPVVDPRQIGQPQRPSQNV